MGDAALKSTIGFRNKNPINPIIPIVKSIYECLLIKISELALLLNLESLQLFIANQTTVFFLVCCSISTLFKTLLFLRYKHV